MKIKKLSLTCHAKRGEASGAEKEEILRCAQNDICFEPVSKQRRRGVTLPEMTVVITIAALILAMTIPAVNMLLNSFESESGAKSIINAALASARSMAIKNQQYAGIRFQKRYDVSNPDPLKESQYMIFVIHGGKQSNSLEYGFWSVDGIQPIKLPDSIGVMDLNVRINRNPGDYPARDNSSQPINNNSLIDEPEEVNDASAFSIIFSPSGKLVVHEARMRNKDEVYQPDNSSSSKDKHSFDDIFNSPLNIINYQVGMFVQDDYSELGYGSEMSRNCFYIIDSKIFQQEYKKGTAWTGYLQRIAQKPVYINPYTGTIVDEK